MSTIPGNSLQDRLKHIQILQKTKPVRKQRVECIIVDVYDINTLNETFKAQIKDPSQTYGNVKVGNEYYFLPFKKTSEEMYSLYGDSINLRNRKALIEYTSRNIKSGKIVLNNLKGESLLELGSSVNIFSIGGIF